MTSSPTPSPTSTPAPHEVADALWDRAAAAGDLLRTRNDAKALHAFRVAIRRLRTCLESYPEFQSGEGLRLRKKLAKVMRKTNARRDLDVHRAMCHEQLGNAEPGTMQHEGFTEIIARLEDPQAAADNLPAPDLVARFAQLRRRADRLLSESNGDAIDPPTLPEATRPVIRRLVRQLREDLDAITDATMEEAIHRTRLTVKRLRYLTEPLKRSVDAVPSLLAEVKEIQARLGDLHDLHTFERRVRAMRDPTPTMLAAADAIRDDTERRFRQLHDRWLEPERPALVERAEAVVDRLT